MILKPSKQVQFAVSHLKRVVKLKGKATLDDFELITKNFTEKEKIKVKRVLNKGKIIEKGDVLTFSDDYVGDEERILNEFKSLFNKNSYLKSNADYLECEPYFYNGVVATGFPEIIKSDWFGKFNKENFNVDQSMFISPESSDSVIKYLQRELNKIEDEIYVFSQRGLVSRELEERKKLVKSKILDLSENKYKMFLFSWYVLCKSKNLEDLKKVSKMVSSALPNGGIEGKSATNYQKQLFFSCLPLGIDVISGREIYTTSKVLKGGFMFRK